MELRASARYLTAATRWSHLHLHDLVVGGHYLIAHLHEKLERKVGLLGGEGDFVQLLAFAGEESVYRIGRVVLETFHFGNGVAQNGLKCRAAETDVPGS